MAFQFRRSMKILPGVRATFTHNGIGLSTGIRGARVSRSPNGRVTGSVGIPGSGLSYRKTLGKLNFERSSGGRVPSLADTSNQPQEPREPFRFGKWFRIALIAAGVYALFDFITHPAGYRYEGAGIAAVVGVAFWGGIAYLFVRLKRRYGVLSALVLSFATVGVLTGSVSAIGTTSPSGAGPFSGVVGLVVAVVFVWFYRGMRRRRLISALSNELALAEDELRNRDIFQSQIARFRAEPLRLADSVMIETRAEAFDPKYSTANENEWGTLRITPRRVEVRTNVKNYEWEISKISEVFSNRDPLVRIIAIQGRQQNKGLRLREETIAIFDDMLQALRMVNDPRVSAQAVDNFLLQQRAVSQQRVDALRTQLADLGWSDAGLSPEQSAA